MPQVYPRIGKFSYRVTTQTEFDETLAQLFGTPEDKTTIENFLAGMDDAPLEDTASEDSLESAAADNELVKFVNKVIVDAYNQKVRDITRFDRSNPAIKPRLRDALEEAAKLFAGSGDRRKVAVLLRAEYCTTDFEFFPGQCTGIPAAEDAALALRQLGVTIVVVIALAAQAAA